MQFTIQYPLMLRIIFVCVYLVVSLTCNYLPLMFDTFFFLAMVINAVMVLYAKINHTPFISIFGVGSAALFCNFIHCRFCFKILSKRSLQINFSILRKDHTQSAFTCSKSITATLKQSSALSH